MTTSPDSHVTIIVPPVVSHNLDAHTGIPFMPHMAAHLAGALNAGGHEVQVIDCFGLQPNRRRVLGEFMAMGTDEQWVIDHLHPATKVVFIYCRNVEEFIMIERLSSMLKAAAPKLHICLFENIQSVNSYSLRHVVADFFAKGCDAAILGEPEDRCNQVVAALREETGLEDIAGVAYCRGGVTHFTREAPFNKELDRLPFPLWEKFPLEGYWQAGFAHAPVGSYRFLPILTSRGCPFRCTFCISPEVNPTWRPRSARNVVDEMEYFHQTLGVVDFHVSDLDPTINDKRTQEICKEIINRCLPVTWKLAQGTKIETIKSEVTLGLMARAGCRFIAFSPESGSPRLLEIMNKPFDHAHGLRMTATMNQLGIRSQACFLAGVPGENEDDRNQSVDYVKKLVAAGIDEIAVYIFTPLPGAALAKSIGGFTHYSQCTRSPTWRSDYREVHRFRRRMYLIFFLHKLAHPSKTIREVSSLFRGQFETKMEMSVFKQLKLYLLRFTPFLFPKLKADERLRSLAQVRVGTRSSSLS